MLIKVFVYKLLGDLHFLEFTKKLFSISPSFLDKVTNELVAFLVFVFLTSSLGKRLELSKSKLVLPLPFFTSFQAKVLGFDH
jgi:hypothetical protein